MPIEQITSRNMSEGLHVLFIYINDITNGVFMQILLFSIWSIVVFGIYFAQKRDSTAGDFPMALAVGGVITVVFATLMRLIDGLLDPITYTITIVVALISVIFFFFSKD
jgi:multidrug transporter EmrE-like cation transporter